MIHQSLRAAARPRVIGGNASPRSPAFFQRTFPVFKSFSKVYYARIVKSPLISALDTSLDPRGKKRQKGLRQLVLSPEHKTDGTTATAKKKEKHRDYYEAYHENDPGPRLPTSGGGAPML